MRRPIWPAGLAAGLVGVLATVFSPSTAFAQGGPVDVQMFRPAMDSKGIVSVESTQVLSPGMFSIGLTANYAQKPLVLKGDLRGGTERTFQVKNPRDVDLSNADLA